MKGRAHKNVCAFIAVVDGIVSAQGGLRNSDLCGSDVSNVERLLKLGAVK